MIRILLPAVLLLGSCAITPQARERTAASDARDAVRLAKALNGYTAEPAVDCIDTFNADVRTFGDTLVYRNRSNRLYLTRTGGGCFGLRRDDIIVTRIFGSRTCRGDIIRTVDRVSGFPSGACAFGAFTPYRRERGRGAR